MKVNEQNLGNHARFHPPFHFVMVPLLLIHFLHTCVRLWRNPSMDTADGVLLAIALIVMGGLTRINALKAQDRVIRLEERLRYQRVLPADLARRADQLTESQIIALRFAPDAELPGLIEQTLSGKLTKSGEIKKAIVNWRGDYFRV